jgi:enoyl-CoA hydratase/carnithine racemase
MSNSDNNAVLFERIGKHIALVTLNREDKRNAVNGDITRGLSAAIATVENDPELRVAILAAKGAVFCAGADLSEVSKGGGSQLSTPEGGFGGFVKAPRSKPWIAAVAGKALGGGCEFALTCDLVVAGAQAQFGLPEVKRGIIAGAGGAFRIARALPRSVGIEMAITGLPITAQQALHHGLVNRVVDGDVVAAAIELAEEVAVNAPLSVRESLRLARAAYDLTEEELWEETGKSGALVMQSEDAKEGPRAFLEKRAPQWKGR